MGDQPNILWICTDQQRWDTLGCYGNPFVHTPNLDALSASGARFDTAFCQSPVSTPSRACFLTGRYPRTTRARQNGQTIPADEILLPRVLADAGYYCGLAGKLHLSPCQPHVCPESERRIDDGYATFHWSHHPGEDWGLHNEYMRWLAENNVTFKRKPFQGSKWVQTGPDEAYHHTTWCVDRAIEFMRDRAEDGTPWLFSVNLFDPHHAFDPPHAYLERYLPILDDIPLPNYVSGEFEAKPEYQLLNHTGAYNFQGLFSYPEMTARDHRLVRAAYWAMCDLIDAQLGRLMTALSETQHQRNTLVIYMSDHGELLGDHGIYLKGPFFYEPAIRVPLIMAFPGIIRPLASPALVELTDIAETILDAVALPHVPGMQGRSLWPLLTGQTDPTHHRDDIYCEYYNAMANHTNPAAHLTMLRTDQWKLVLDHTTSRGELYDLKADPTETRNLWNETALLETKSTLLVRLANRMAWTVDPLPPREALW